MLKSGKAKRTLDAKRITIKHLTVTAIKLIPWNQNKKVKHFIKQKPFIHNHPNLQQFFFNSFFNQKKKKIINLYQIVDA